MNYSQKDRLDRIQHKLLSNIEKIFYRKRISGAVWVKKPKDAILIE
jgi:hypothetical protein